MRKRAFAWLLSFAMLLSFIPNTALANEPNSQNSILEVEQPEAANISDAQDAQTKVAETTVEQDKRLSAETETFPTTQDETEHETLDGTQPVIPEEGNRNAMTDVLEQNADAHLAEETPIQGLTPVFTDAQKGTLLGESVEIIASGECGANGGNVTWALAADGLLTISGIGAMADFIYIYAVPWSNKASQIKEVDIKSGVTSIGSGAFAECNSLTSVAISQSVTNIGEWAFGNCIALTNVVIPEGVTSIGRGAFDNCNSLTSLTIPEGVISIEDSTFRNCTSLTSVTILEGVTVIGDEAFYDCSALTSVIIPESVTSVGQWAFSDCSSLTNVVIPESVTSIGNGAFTGCSALESVTIPEGVTSIGNGAFEHCHSLTSVTIPEGVTSIAYVFANCSALTSVTIPEGMTSIGDGAFYNCSALTSVTIPESVISIGNEAFYDCSALTSVIIPESVTSIGSDAFTGCSVLESLTIPKGVTNIGNGAFVRCSAMTSIHVHGDNQTYKSVDGVLFNKQGTDLLRYPQGKTVETYVIPNGVTSIGSSAFWGCNYLTSVTLPEGVVSIESCAFYSCSALASVTIPEGITNIKHSAFEDCFDLTSVAIPESLTNIEYSAFHGCVNLAHIYYESSGVQWNAITIGGDNASLTSAQIHYNWGQAEIIASGECGVNGDNVTWTLDSKGQLTISGAGAMADCGISVSSGGWTDYESAPWKTAGAEILFVVVENGVTNLGAGAFGDCNELISVVIPKSVISIGDSAFLNCGALTNVMIPDSVSSIGEDAFAFCVALTSITIPDNVTLIRDRAFSNCISLTSVTISEDVTSIGDSAFCNCDNLRNVTIPNCVINIGGYAFTDCDSLTSVTIPTSVTNIGDLAFYGCSALTDIYYFGNEEQWNTITKGSNYVSLTSTAIHYNWREIIASGECGANGANVTWTLDGNGLLIISGDGTMVNCANDKAPWIGNTRQIIKAVIESGVTSIANDAFKYCNALTSVSIPDSVTSIGEGAFEYCAALTSVWIPNSVTSIRDFTFFSCSALTSVRLPESVTSIGRYAFKDCRALTSINIPNSVTFIASYAFEDCSALTSVTIPDNVTNIASWTFNGCSTLTGVTIPDGVSSIGMGAFFACSSLTSVTIPDSLTSIGEGAFMRCSALTDIQADEKNASFSSVDGILFDKGQTVLVCYPAGKDETSYAIPDSVTNIGNNAFAGCSALASMAIPDSVTSIGNNAFRDCVALTSVCIPHTVNSIGDVAFYGCNALTDVYYTGSEGQWDAITKGSNNAPLASATIHYNWVQPEIVASGECGANGGNLTWTLDADGLLTISGVGSMASEDSTNVIPGYERWPQAKQVAIQSGVTSIGDAAFHGCSGLTRVTIPDSVTSVGNMAFAECSALTDVNIPDSVTSIGQEAFERCSSLTSMTIPNSIESIGKYAFGDCSGLTSITIPDSITSIGEGAFSRCFGLERVTISNGVTCIGDAAFAECSALTDVTIPNSITSIGNWAFFGCNNLTGVTLPNSVTSIGESAFNSCGLTSVTIPDRVISIGLAAFLDCSALANVTIGNGLISIGNGAFERCGSLTSMTIPDSITSIGDGAFLGCSALTSIQVSTGNDSFSDLDGVLFNKDCTNLICYPLGKSGSYVIPDGVTSIGKSAFYGYGYSNLTGVTIPDSVTSIGDSAFCVCESLTEVTIPDSVTFIGNGAFYDCRGLTSVTIGDSVASIGNSAFSGCRTLAIVTIGDSVTSIGNGAFSGCSALTDIYYLGSNEKWNAITIEGGNSLLTSATIHYNWGQPEIIASGECGANGDNVTWTLDADGVLTISGTGAMADYSDVSLTPWADKRSQITQVVIESGVASVGANAFIWSRLTSVTIPDSVTAIGANAFYGSGLVSVTIPKNVTSIGSYAFSYCSGLTSIQAHSENEAYKSVDGVLFNKEGTILLCYPRGRMETSYSIPNGVTNLGAFSFSACNALTSVTIPTSVTGIALGAFCECSALTDVHYLGSEAQWNTVTIGDSNAPLTSAAIHYNWGQPEIISTGECGADGGNVVWTLYSDGTLMLIGQGKIRDYAWSGANVSPWYYSSGSKVKNIIIGDGITRIGRSVFEGCKNLISVTIPVSVVSVGTAFFSSGLKTVYYTGSQAQFSKISIQNNLLGENDIFINAEKHYNTVPSSAPTPVIAHTIETISPVDASTIGGISPLITVTMGGLFPFNLSVTAEKDGDITEIPVKDAMKTSGGKSVHTLTLDLSALESGLYQFRFFNSDYGIEKSVSYDVDRSAPSKPENFRVVPGNLKNTLAWDTAKEADVSSIRIYRTTNETAEPELLVTLSGRTAVTYTDNGLEDSVTYYYWLSFVDKFSQESEKAGPVAGTPTSDNEPPSITTVYPADGTTLTGSVSFRVTASDNQRVKSVAMEISTEVGESASWETLEAVETTGQAEFTLDSTRYNVDTLYVRFLAEDASGNTAYSKLTYTFPVDNTPPETVSSITGEASATSITLHWTYDAPSDFSHFTLEKRDGSGTYAKVGGNLTSLGAQINNLTPGTEYSFRVMAFDVHGNHSEYSEEYSVTTSADTAAPVITAMSPQPGRYNGSIPLLFTATDNDSIQSMTYQTSNDGLEWTDATTITVSSGNKTVAVSYSFNTASFEEGILYVRAVASDASGNVSDTSNNAPYTQYMVDRTAPAAPRALEGVSVSGTVYLTWLQGTEQDLNGYTVERAYEENGSYSALATAWKKLSYTDSGVAAGQTYYYRLRSQDTAGNASDYSKVVAVTVESVPDTEAPRIVSVSPSDGYILGSNTPIRVSVSDNQLVATLSVQYSVDGENWNSLEEITVSATSGVVTLPLTASDIDSDALSLRVSCTDGVGLTSGTVSRAYSIDTTLPAAPVITAEAAAMSVVLNWTSGNESDLAGFYIYRKAGGESEYSYLTQCGKNTTSYTDSKVIAERNYSYYVSAIDARSNQSSSTPTKAVKPLNIDVEPPVIRASGDTIGTVGIEMQFSAKNTTDNFGASGLSYAWNFGDGGTSALLEPRHTYKSAGAYTVSLTVTDSAGNSSSGQISVTVKEATEAAWLDVTVRDDSGNPISGAGVYFDLGEEEQETVYTNNSGVARVTAKEGTFTVGVYKNGYLPEKAENVTLIKGATASVTVQLVKKNIVTGRLTVERMTLEEIEAAGIDTTDPANQQVFQYEITLAYGSEPVNIQTKVNGNGRIISDPKPITITDNAGTRVLHPFVFDSTTTVTNITNGSRDTQNLPIIAIMDLPGETKWLKEFFDVHLYVFNQANGEYVLDKCVAKLNVPEGLTLVDSNRTTASPVVEMGSITGQNSATAEWILRGDEKGDYTLSADFTATLRDFNESIHATFTTEEPVRVYGMDAVKMIADINTTIAYGGLYVDLSLQNISENSVYLPRITLLQDSLELFEKNAEEEWERRHSDGYAGYTILELNVLLQNTDGVKQYLGAGATVDELTPGETYTKQYVIYNAVTSTDLAYLIDAISTVADANSIQVEIRKVEKDLFSVAHAEAKYDNIFRGFDDSEGSFYYINRYFSDHRNYYYMMQAADDDTLATAFGLALYASANAVLNFEWKNLLSDEAEREVARQYIYELLMDESYQSSVENEIDIRMLELTNSILTVVKDFIPDYVGDSAGEISFTDFFEAINDNIEMLENTVKSGNVDSFTDRLVVLFGSTCGMAATTIVKSGLETLIPIMLQQDTLDLANGFNKNLEGAIDTINTGASVVGNIAEAWRTAIQFKQQTIAIQAAHNQALMLTDFILSYDEIRNTGAYKEVQKIHDALIDGFEEQQNVFAGKLMSELFQNKDLLDPLVEKYVFDSIDDAFGYDLDFTSTVFSALRVTFNLADYVFGWEDSVDVFTNLHVAALLSMALNEAKTQCNQAVNSTTGNALMFKVRFLNVLKYVIKMRLVGERAYVRLISEYEGADKDYNAEKVLSAVNADCHENYSSLNDYYLVFKERVLSYRDILYNEPVRVIDRPDMPIVTIDYSENRTVQKFDADYEYQFDGGGWIPCGDGENADHISITPFPSVRTLRVRKKANSDTLSGVPAVVAIPSMSYHPGATTVAVSPSREYVVNGLLTDSVYEVLLSANNETEGLDWFRALRITTNAEGQMIVSGNASGGYLLYRLPATDTDFASVTNSMALSRIYSVTLNTNGGEINSGNVSGYTEGLVVTLPTDITRNGYTFGGWYGTEDFTGGAVTEISATDTGDKTFYAKWIPAADAVPGDIDGDGVVGMKDLSALRRYLNGWDVAVITEAMDVDADGSVTMKDFSLLRRYLNGWPVTLGQEDAGLSGVMENPNAGEIEFGRVSARAGETVTVPLAFKSNPGIVAYRLYVSYDETELELLESKTGDMTSVSFGPLENPFNILWDESLGGNVTGNAVIAELTFRVKEDASGYSPVSVTYVPDDIYNSDLVNVPFQVSNGGVEILSATGIAGKPDETSSHSVTVSGGSGSGEYAAGDSVTIRADPPPEGKVFDRWTGTDGIQFISGGQNSVNAVFRMPDGDVVLNAAFRDQKLQGCYVATAVYGSYDCPEVWTLRRFRDNVLAKTWYGRLFIRLYYAVSPTAVRLFGDAQWFRDFWREKLNRMVTELQAEGFESTPYADRDWN